MGSNASSETPLAPLIKPWRNIGDNKDEKEFVKQLKNEIAAFIPEKVGKWNIAIIGSQSAGKSSFVNTLESCYCGYVSKRLKQAPKAGRSITEEFTIHNVGGLTHFNLYDTRGIDDNFGFDSADFDHLLKGHIKSGYQFDPKEPIKTGDKMFRQNPTKNDMMHCVCFVFKANTFDSEKPEDIIKIRSFISVITKQKALRFIVLLTHVDLVCPLVDDDPSKMYKSPIVLKTVKKVASKLSIDENDVVPMRNYKKETEVETSINMLGLYALRQLLRRARDFTADIVVDTDISPKV